MGLHAAGAAETAIGDSRFRPRRSAHQCGASVGTGGDAYDNAMAESFFASLECELIDRRSWKTMTEARLAIFTWIEAWYNPHRRHKGIQQQAPINFERSIEQQKNSANQVTELFVN